MRYEMVYNPGQSDQVRQPFTVSEGDMEEAAALEGGPVEWADVAYYKAVFDPPTPPAGCEDAPFVIVHGGKIVGRSVGTEGVTDADLRP